VISNFTIALSYIIRIFVKRPSFKWSNISSGSKPKMTSQFKQVWQNLPLWLGRALTAQFHPKSRKYR